MTELPPFVHRKVAKGLTYYYFAVQGRDETKPVKLVRLPDISDPKFNAKVLEVERLRTKQEAENDGETCLENGRNPPKRLNVKV